MKLSAKGRPGILWQCIAPLLIIVVVEVAAAWIGRL